MSLNIIIGKSNSGKSEYMINKIMACEKASKQAILFVPSSKRIIAEEEYLKYTNKNVLMDTVITSIERFVNRNVDKNKLYENKTYLKDLAKKMMIRRLINQNEDLFKVFAKVKNTVGFTDKIADYMNKFENLEDLDVLDKYEEQDFLKNKLEEFKKIYIKIEQELKEKFITSTDEMKEYISYLHGSPDNTFNAEVFIDSYNNFSEIEYEFIQALLLQGNNVYITLDIDINKYLEQMTEIYNTSYETLTKLKELGAKIGVSVDVVELKRNTPNTPQDIWFLSNNIFNISRDSYKRQVENVKLVLRSNTYEEIKYVASDILSKKKQGYEYKDIAIYTNNIDMYNVYLKKIFSLYKIPIYLNEQDKLTDNRLLVFLLAMLKLTIGGFAKSIDEILIILKTGMLDIDEREVYEFEKYLFEFGVRGYNFYNKFELNNNYDIDVINNVRQVVVDSVENLRSMLLKNNSSKQITEAIYNYLIDFNVIERYEKHLQIVNKIDINEYNKSKQAVAKLYEIMDNICMAYDSLSLEEYVNLIEYGINKLSLDTIPAKVDEVEIIDINKIRGTEKKIVYIIGCYDGGLPTAQAEDNIFTDIELEKLKACGIDLKQTSEQRNNMQLFNIYQAISKARDKIIITVPSSSSDGASLRPSSLVQEIKGLLNISLGSDSTNIVNIDEDFMDFMTKLKEINNETSEEEISKLYLRYLLYKDMDKYNSILEYSRKDENLKDTTLKLIYKDKVNSSVSRLEQFNKCPFAYYAKYVLNIKERKEYVMSNLDIGSFMHEVIEKFSKYIVSKNIAWQDIVLDENKKENAKRKINEIVDKLFEEEYGKYLTSAKHIVLKSKLKKAIERSIFAIADSFNHSEFRPLGYEVEFEKGALFAPIEIKLDSGTSLLLRGKIDRIDSLNLGYSTYLRIVDYKSSDKNLKLSDIKSGISLQLMTYMWAMMENKDKLSSKNVIPAALSYFTLSNKILSIPTYEQDESKIIEQTKKALKLKGIYIRDLEILKKLDNNALDSTESYLEVSKRNMNSDEKVLPEEVFIEECNNIKQILKSIGEEIVKGCVKIKPNVNTKNACEYCEYKTVCRKNILN